MEPTDDFATSMCYVREHGSLHLYTNVYTNVYTNSTIDSGYRSNKDIEHHDCPPSAITISNNVTYPCDNILSLFDLCLGYLSTNVRNIVSLVGFPDMIGEKIFTAVRNQRILQTLADHDCALVLRMFGDAYCGSMLQELSVKSLAVLDQHIECFSAFCHVTKLDVTGCMLGDNHDYLLHIGHLTR